MKSKKTWFILSLLCILSGTFLMIAGTILGGIPGFYLDKTGVHSSREGAENTVKVFQDALELEAFDRMELNVHYADVTLIPSDHYAVEYRITGTVASPDCKVENGTLFFQDGPLYHDPRIWFLYDAPNVSYMREPEPESYYVKIEYPVDLTFSDISVWMECGDLTFPDLYTDTLKLTNEYGDVSLNNCTGQDLEISMSSGDFTAKTITADVTSIQNEYGDLTLQAYTGRDLILDTSSSYLSLDTIQAEQFQIRDDYGDILIRQASGENLQADQNTGSFLADQLDYTSTKIQNEYGSVQLRLLDDLADYEYDLHTDYGFIRIDGNTIHNGDDDEASYHSPGKGEKAVEISCENGDIVIERFLVAP